MANKKTQKDYYNEIIAILDAQGETELVDFCKDRIEKLDKKTASRKSAATSEENVPIMDEIMSVVTEEGQTVSDLQKKSEVLSPLSNQKVSAMVRFLESEGKIIRYKDGKKTLVKLA